MHYPLNEADLARYQGPEVNIGDRVGIEFGGTLYVGVLVLGDDGNMTIDDLGPVQGTDNGDDTMTVTDEP